MHTPASNNKLIKMSNMTVTNRFSIKALLRTAGAQPRQNLGQNFLISSAVSRKIIETAQIKPNDTILEIGPGLGSLTLQLAEKAKKVIAIEKDKKIAAILTETLKEKSIENVEIINEDILYFKSEARNPKHETNQKFQIQNLKQNYQLIANLPYNIATAVIMKFLEAKNPPEMMVVMVQKEVGQRLCASPPQMSKLAIFSQLYSQPRIVGYVAKECFYPRPKVNGAILKIIPNKKVLSAKSLKLFSKIVKAGFNQPRKQLINNLSNGLKLERTEVADWLNKNNIKPSQRAETVSIDNWLKLTATFSRQLL